MHATRCEAVETSCKQVTVATDCISAVAMIDPSYSQMAPMCTSCLIHSSFGLGESASKRHLDRFSRFCTAHRWAQHAHSPTDRHTSRHFVCSMVAFTMQAMRPKWKSLQESDDIVSRSPALPARQKCVTRNCELDGAISVKLQEACIVEHWNKILSLIVCVKSTIFFSSTFGPFFLPVLSESRFVFYNHNYNSRSAQEGQSKKW